MMLYTPYVSIQDIGQEGGVNFENNGKFSKADERLFFGGESAVASDDGYFAALAYPAFFLPIILRRKSDFVLFHVNQSFWLFLFSSLLFFVNNCLYSFALFVVLVSGGQSVFILVCPFFVFALSLFLVVFYITLGIRNSLKLRQKSLPGFEKLPHLV